MRFPSYQGRFYTTQPRLHRGGQAVVFQAADDDGRLYAVKQALPGEDEGWLEEERALVEDLLRRWPDLTDHIVPIVDAGEHEGRPFLVMPWVEHRLDAWLRERPLEDRLLALERLAESVSRLQYGPEGARGEVVHRDVKPSNVFVEEREGSLRVLLSDFGAAGRRHRYAQAFLTGRHTEGFAPLDQILPRRLDRLDPSWDVYALATTVYHGLTGQPLHGVQQSYGDLTVHGRNLKQAAADFERDPTNDTYRHILELSSRPLGELANLAAIQPLRDEDRAVLDATLRAALADRVASAARLAAWMSHELCQELERALAPDPARRSADARGLRDALARLREVVATALRGEPTFLDAPRGPRRWPLFLAAGLALAAGTGLYAAWPRPRDLKLHVEGVPAWSSLRVGLDGAIAEGFHFAGLARGEHGLVLEGGVAGEGERCAWRRELPLVVGAGLGTAHRVVALPDPPRCPGAEAGYATVRVEPGTFWIGSTDEEWYREPDEVRREVTLTQPLALGTTEVTQAMWRSVAAFDPALPPDPMRTARVGPFEDGTPGEPCATYLGLSLLGDDLPVACVTWREALRFANALSVAEGLEPAYQGTAWNRDADGWRLPTEAEWEVAARAGDRHVLFAGSFHAEGDRACAELYRYANVADPAFGAAFPHLRVLGPAEAARLVDPRCAPGTLHDDGYAGLAPVGSYQPNAWGLQDLSGNLREWTWDVYDHAPAAGPQRVFRGSAFDDGSTALRLADRGAGGPDTRYIYVGLRLARNL